MKSKRGIYYDIKCSEYRYTIDNFTFVFSSLFYLNLFKNSIDDVKYEQDKINTKLKNYIDLRELILLNQYKKIEKRGFLVYYRNKELKEYSFKLKLEMR